MCLPAQLSHGASPHISLSCPNVQNRLMHISYKHPASLMLSSHFLLWMEPSSPQTGVSAHLSHLAFSLVTKTHVPQDIPGIPGMLLPLPYQDGFPRDLCSLLSGPHGRHSLESSILGRQPFDFCQGRAVVPGIGEKNQMEFMITCPSRVSICISDEMSSKRAPTRSNCREKCLH